MVPFENLLVMPGDVHDVHRRLVWPRDQQRLACERVHGPARLVSRDIQAGHADLPVLGDAQDTQVEERVVQYTQCECIRDLVGALLAVPAHVGRFDPDRVMAERPVESAHRALVCVGAQDLFRESAAPRPRAGSLGNSLASGQVENGHVKVDRSADQLLPYALHFAMVSREEVPLARFAQDWGRAFADLPGGRPAWQKRQFDDDALFKTRRPPGWIG